MQRMDFYLTESQIIELKKLSEETGLSVSELIRRAVDRYLKDQKNDS